MTSEDLRAVLIAGFIVLAIIVLAVNGRVQKRREWEAYYKSLGPKTTRIPPGYELKQTLRSIDEEEQDG